ncbi:nuclear transport factor 2 family protein [Sphingomonas lycopersici]|uniref:Nuclear transport factor 2 family protein n=1 Tax=Sphingomonas lycopersici TaxID=2951807 RepID=A0AA41Z910_9SPHN|nr:nuclear transport factor 2 family protein [Sphingomonas lycopersici]MCW6530947.1 nuclear transport factor 2 family protein [Sphingomonas lycopersici]MCW6534811.1 nuclear transport factor 2 family protein [Sphingomonas lycopersici]
MSDLETRIARLEAESDIRRLKARYLNACDAKDVDAIRACFTPDAEIDFPPIGTFGVDGLIDVFTQMAATTPIVDVHQGHNGEIEVDGDEAKARWNLGYATYDPRSGTFRLLANFYQDRYRKTPEGWRICYSRSEPRAIVDGAIGPEGVKAGWVAAG